MIREGRFVLSRKQFAVNLSSLRIDAHGTPWIKAAWYRRRRGVTVACLGTLDLFDARDAATQGAIGALESAMDGRYGGDCHGRWDGENYWGAQRPEVMGNHLEILRPMLDNLPAIPPGFDGWWRYPTTTEREAARRG